MLNKAEGKLSHCSGCFVESKKTLDIMGALGVWRLASAFRRKLVESKAERPWFAAVSSSTVTDSSKALVSLFSSVDIQAPSHFELSPAVLR